MATRLKSQPIGCIFQWRIENLTNCYWLEEEVPLKSPTFIANAFNDSKWSLDFYPMGQEFDDNVSIFLVREEDNGPDVVEVNFHLALLSKEGTFLKGFYYTHGFKKNDSLGKGNFESRKRIFFSERKEFLPEDVLTVQCTLRKTYDAFFSVKHVFARSISEVTRRSLLWKIDNYSTVGFELRNKFKDNFLDLDLVFMEDSFRVKVISYDNKIKYIGVHVSIIDSEGRKKSCADMESIGYSRPWGMFGPVEYGKFEGDLFIISSFPFRWKQFKNRYIPNDVLTLAIDYVYSTITNSLNYLDTGSISQKLSKEIVKNGDKHCVAKGKSSNAPALIDDLKCMYIDGILSDTKLQTSSQTFPVHRSILSARSPVFSRMFCNDMKEKNSGIVHITDLENDTVHRMLLFLYTDILEDLQFESALKLYEAADKYEILSLKCKGSSFMKDNLCPAKACDTLILADSRQDEELKSFVQSYILGHDDVFSLKEWKDLMEKNLKLAADIMFKKIKPHNV